MDPFKLQQSFVGMLEVVGKRSSSLTASSTLVIYFGIFGVKFPNVLAALLFIRTTNLDENPSSTVFAIITSPLLFVCFCKLNVQTRFCLEQCWRCVPVHLRMHQRLRNKRRVRYGRGEDEMNLGGPWSALALGGSSSMTITTTLHLS